MKEIYQKKEQTNHDFQFYITRYPFPNEMRIKNIKFYKTFYQLEGGQLQSQKIMRITQLNKLTSLIKLKQIVKNSVKSIDDMDTRGDNKILVHSYSLYYQIVPTFILSQMGLKIIKQLPHQQITSIFQKLSQDIDHLIQNKIFYLIDIQNIAITSTGKVKIYIPAKNIIEDITFTDKHQKEMKSTTKKVINYLQRYIQQNLNENCIIDVDRVKTEIKKQLLLNNNHLQYLDVNNKNNEMMKSVNNNSEMRNIQSQIFTFNQNQHNSFIANQILLQEGVEEHNNENNRNKYDLQKTVKKIRKSSQKLNLVIDLNMKEIKTSDMIDKLKINHVKCITARQYINRKQNQKYYDKNNISLNSCRENDHINQKMKDYQIKLLTLDQTVKQIKQEILQIHNNKKERKQQQNNTLHRQRSRTLTNFKEIREEDSSDINQICQKLSSSRLEIKKLLLNQTDLRQSYHLEEDNQLNQQEHQIDDQEYLLKKQIQNLFGCTFPLYNQTKKPKVQSPQNKPKKYFQPLQSKTLKNLIQNVKLNEIKQEKSNSIKRSNQKSKKSPSQESSWGKTSPPGGNPFRQYGNFRIQYVVDEENKSNKEKNEVNEGGQIKIYHQKNAQPFKIGNQEKKSHFFTPLSHLQQNFRYSSLALQKRFQGQSGRIPIPENIYDPTEYDSLDTFEMQVGRDEIMPRIISKAAFRHTLFPSSMFGRIKPTKDVEKSQQNVSNKEIKQRQDRRNYKSVDKKLNQKPFKAINFKDNDCSSNRSNIKGEIVSPFIICQAQKINGINQRPQKAESDYLHLHDERLSKTSTDLARFANMDVSPSKNLYKKVKQVQGNLSSQPHTRKILDKQKITAILNRSKQIITRYKNLPTKRQ